MFTLYINHFGANAGRQRETLVSEVQSLSEQVATLSTSLQTSDATRSTHASDLETLRQSHASDLEKIQKELEAEKDKLATSASDSSALSDVRSELGKAHARIQELEKERDGLKKAAETADTGGGGKKGKKADTSQADKRADAAEKKAKDLEKELGEEKTKREEGEKEHEDLLVLLEELSQKRKRDKARMKEKGLDVSEGEEDDAEEGEEDVD